jgi:DNA polymerase-3 subunit gamma/tau
VGHAYLFTGARGVGKTSTARILAKALNCVHGPNATPCGECDICQRIAAGDDVDVLEIDGASNRGIDEIRQLRSNVGMRPSRARLKIYIIDEVHMLTKEAFNALLKTLEEPPEHVKFVFCTTEPGKIPITVLSRCQRFDFAPVGTSDIIQRLQYIVQQEGAAATPEALKLLARRAAGSLRDSQSLLEQLLAFVGDEITVDHVHAMLGTARDERLRAIVSPLVKRDAAAALEQLDKAISEGVDPGQLAEQLIASVRDLMAALVGCSGDLLLCHGASELETLRQQAEAWGMDTLLAAGQILDQTLSRMRQSVHGRILLELALVRIAQLEDLEDLSQLLARLDELPGAGGPPAAHSGRRGAPAAKKKIASRTEAAEPNPPRMPDSRPAPSPDASVAAAESAPPAADESPAGPAAQHTEPFAMTPAEAADVWRTALKTIDDMTADFAAHADSVATSAPNRLVVQFQAMYNSSKSFCERPERREKLERAVSEAAGRALRLDFELTGSPAHVVPPRPAVSRQQQMRRATSHPLVERALELFEAEVINVEMPPPERPPRSN